MTRLTFVLWTGTFGGAESLSVELARRAKERGHDATIVFVKRADAMRERANAYAVPFVELQFVRGVEVIRHARHYAATVRSTSPDAVITMSVNHLAWALRVGGYLGPLIAVEHGELMRLNASRFPERQFRSVDRLIATRTVSAEVAVSSFMETHARRVYHAQRLVVIANGVDSSRFSPTSFPSHPLTFGFAGRLVPGKGVENLLDAFSGVAVDNDLRLRIAGSGPLRDELRGRALRGHAADKIDFVGSVADMCAYWNSVDVGVAPSSSFIESFGMSPLEAMACGRPVVVTRNGGFSDLVVDGVTGSVVPPGDTEALAGAMRTYLDPDTVIARGAAARTDVVQRFSLDVCLDSYLNLVSDSTAQPLSSEAAD